MGFSSHAGHIGEIPTFAWRADHWPFLGGGVAALLAALWRAPQRKCFSPVFSIEESPAFSEPRVCGWLRMPQKNISCFCSWKHHLRGVFAKERLPTHIFNIHHHHHHSINNHHHDHDNHCIAINKSSLHHCHHHGHRHHHHHQPPSSSSSSPSPPLYLPCRMATMSTCICRYPQLRPVFWYYDI